MCAKKNNSVAVYKQDVQLHSVIKLNVNDPCRETEPQ